MGDALASGEGLTVVPQDLGGLNREVLDVVLKTDRQESGTPGFGGRVRRYYKESRGLVRRDIVRSNSDKKVLLGVTGGGDVENYCRGGSKVVVDRKYFRKIEEMLGAGQGNGGRVGS